MTLEDWYDDFETRHYLGFLTLITEKNKELVSEYYIEYDEGDKDSLPFHEKIKDKLNVNDIDILDYENQSDKSKIEKCLLLFNILTCINNKLDFDFSRYKSTKFDIEHIYPHSGVENLRSKKEKEDWYDEILNSKLFDELMENYNKDMCNDENQFIEIYRAVMNYNNQPKIENVNVIGNLCLLDKTTNRGYGNKPFPYKVKSITKVDIANDEYILPATKNVFLKYYSGLNINNYIWSKDDADNYKNAIKDKLKTFIKSKKESK